MKIDQLEMFQPPPERLKAWPWGPTHILWRGGYARSICWVLFPSPACIPRTAEVVSAWEPHHCPDCVAGWEEATGRVGLIPPMPECVGRVIPSDQAVNGSQLWVCTVCRWTATSKPGDSVDLAHTRQALRYPSGMTPTDRTPPGVLEAPEQVTP